MTLILSALLRYFGDQENLRNKVGDVTYDKFDFRSDFWYLIY